MNTTSGLLFSVRESSTLNNWSYQLHCTLCRALNSHNVLSRVPNTHPVRGTNRFSLSRYATNTTNTPIRTDRLLFRNFRTGACLASQPESRTLSKHEVNSIIRENERVIDLDEDKGKRCETNHLASNRPTEDQLFITRSTLQERDVLFGVIDGHGGPVFGKVVRQRLPYYLHSALCAKHLQDVLNNKKWSPVDIVDNLYGSPLPSDAPWVKDLNAFVRKLVKEGSSNDALSYTAKLRQLILGANDDESASSLYDDVRETIRSTFKQLDLDLANEIKALAENQDLNAEAKALASSGCCALIAYLMEDELFVANVGDCRAVLGSYQDKSWMARPLSVDHSSAANSGEVQRVLSEHPPEESRTCISYGRLLGYLQPLRAFGDIQFKLTRDELKKIFKQVQGPGYKPFKDLRTPPYLTAEPEVFHYKLDPSDKFIVLASDGLWDILSNEEVVSAVAAYVEGNKTQMLKDKAYLLGISNSKDAFEGIENENAASFLIRYALEGYDEDNLRGLLSMPYPDVRWYRDDITVIVLFLNDYNEEE